MEFQLGVLPTFKVADLSRNHDFVRALGLGGAMVVDYAHDPRQPLLESNAEVRTSRYCIRCSCCA